MRKILFFLLSSVLLPALAFGQGAFIPPQTAFRIVNGVTSPIANATITVCAANAGGIPCSPALVNAVFKDAALTQPRSNPFTADGVGNYQFAAASGTYTVTVTAFGFSGYSYQISVGSTGAGGNINPGTAVSQSTTWNTFTSLWVPTKKPSYDISDPNWGFVCNGSSFNNSAANTLLTAIAGAPANIQITQQNCAMADFVWPANITLDFTAGGTLVTPTDNTTPPGGATFDASGSGSCQGANTSTSCLNAVTGLAPAVTPSAAGESYVIECMSGFSSGNAIITSSISSDIVLPLSSTSTGQHSIARSWLVPNVVAGVRTFSIAFAGNLVGGCGIHAWSGLGPTPYLDGAGSSSAGNSATMTSGAATFQAGDLLIAFGGNNSNTLTCSAGAGFTQPAGTLGCSTATGSTFAMEYQLSSSAGSTTATQTMSGSSSNNWAYQVIGLRPSSARNIVLGDIVNPANRQIFQNATGTGGVFDFTGNTVLDSIRPEWWGAGNGASATTNTAALQAAIFGSFGISPAQARINGSGQNVYNRPLYLTTNYNINGELELFNTIGFSFLCSNRLTAGITQTASNARIINGQANAYGKFGNCNFSGTASSTLPLIDLDTASGTTPVDLKPQFIDFYNDTFGGSCQVAQGVLLAKSGGAAQGSNVNFYDPEFNCFTVAALQVGTAAFGAQNALAISVYNGDFQGNNNYAFADYGGGYIQFFGTTMENGGFVGSPGGTAQTGADFYCNAPQGPIVLYDIRSESRKFLWCDQAEIHDSRTFDGAAFPLPGTTQPVGAILTGTRITGDGAFYTVTSNSSAFNGVGTLSAPLTASSGTSTTLVDTNQAVAGAVTIGSVGVTLTETMTQSVTGSTGTRVNSPTSAATIAGTLTSGNFVFGDTAQQASTSVTCTVGAGNTSTTLNCSNFSGAADGTHTWTDLSTSATFNPSGTPVFVPSSPSMLITAATGSPDATHDWVGGTTGLHYTPTAVPVNQANWTVNGFTGLVLGILSGTNQNCEAVVTSNTATALTFSGGYSTQYPYSPCVNADTTSNFTVDCPWSHSGTVTCGGMQYTYLNEDTIRGGATTTTPMQGRIEDSYFAGGQIKLANGTNGSRTVVKNLTVTRTDWYDSSGGNTPGQFGDNDNSWDVRVTALGGLAPMSWSLPHLGGGGTYLGGLHENWGTRNLCWITGTVGSNGPPANTSGAETCVGGSNDPGAGTDIFRNRVTLFSGTGHAAFGPPVPTGTDQNGLSLDLLGGGSTGAGTPGGINFKIGNTGSSGTTPNSGATAWSVQGSTGNLVAAGAQTIVLGTTTVGALPSAASNPGAMIRVSDSTSVSAEGQTCVGLSSNNAIAISNGSAWKCF